MFGEQAVVGQDDDGRCAVDEWNEKGSHPFGEETVTCYLFTLSAPRFFFKCYQIEAHESSAVEFHHNGMFAAFELLGHENCDFDFMISNLLVRGTVHVEAV